MLEYLQPANSTKLTWLLQRAAYAEAGKGATFEQNSHQ